MPIRQQIRRAASDVKGLARPRGSAVLVREATQALLRGDQKLFSSRSRLAVLGLRRVPSVAAALDSAIDHANGDIDHATASERLRDATQDPSFARQPVAVLIAMEKLTRSSGLLAASLEVTGCLWEAVESRAGRSGDPDDLLAAAIAAIHAGDRERASARLDAARPHFVDGEPRVSALACYLDMWQDPNAVRRQPIDLRDEVESRMARAAAGRGVLIYGPGPAERLPTSCGPDPLVVRIMMPEVYAWTGHTDLANGRSDVAYMNYEAQEWLSGLGSERRDEIVSHFSFLVCKKTDAHIRGFQAGNMRLARSASALFLSGSENTVPAIVFDLLSFMDELISVVGVTFFASEVAYRDDSRRLRPKQGITVDEKGRTGRPFERCAMLANHNALENRAIVRNLTLAGRVSGDEAFMRVIGWSDRSYLENLDAIYGIARM